MPALRRGADDVTAASQGHDRPNVHRDATNS